MHTNQKMKTTQYLKPISKIKTTLEMRMTSNMHPKMKRCVSLGSRNQSLVKGTKGEKGQDSEKETRETETDKQRQKQMDRNRETQIQRDRAKATVTATETKTEIDKIKLL